MDPTVATPKQREDDAGREAATAALPTSLMAIVGLICAVAVVLQRAAAPAPSADDGLVEASGPIASVDPRRMGPPPTVDATSLSFPDVLTDPDERVGTGGLPPELMARLPGAVAALAACGSLQRGARQDPLVAAAMRAPAPKRAVAPEGRAGAFTLHVISYDRAEPARALALGLRARGHSAFVATAEVPERGRSFRVRIGPFASRKEADTYRRRFEAEEQMNSVVLRENEAPALAAP